MKIPYKQIYLLTWLLVHAICPIRMGPILPAPMLPISGTISTALAIGNISRYNDGDTFRATGGECGPDTCVGLSSGTAGEKFGQTCTCQCLNHLPAFRDDLHICVDDIHECPLAPFVSGSISQMIPFVFLPLKGQIVHPSKEISFAGVQRPLCAVSGAQFLTRAGWVDLRNPIDADVPFRLFRDEGRTFLQWLGDSKIRQRMAGRLILVHMLCRDIAFSHQPPEMQTVFTPCVAFRVVGSPVKHHNNVSEVVFSPDAQSSVYTTTAGLNSTEYIAIGICSVLLGLIYVASVFLYLHLRKRKEAKTSNKTSTTTTTLNQDHKPNSGTNGAVHEKPPSNDDATTNIKSNPLMGLAARHFQTSSFSENRDSDEGGTSGDCMSDADGLPDVLQNHNNNASNGDDIFWRSCTQALVHPARNFLASDSLQLQESPSIERHPEENVSIVETIEGREDRPDTVKSIVNNNARRKLYFNPAYFEPHLLMAPPPAAIEFLTKIREVITIAKQKMASKRFTPSLMGIPEEDAAKDYIYIANSRNSIVSLKRENSRRRQLDTTPACANCNNQPMQGKLADLKSLPTCKSCTVSVHEHKKRSIHKWLEDVPILKSPATSVRSEDPRILSSYINDRLKASFDKICLPERSPSFYSENKHHKKPKVTLNQSIMSRSKKIPAPIIPKQHLPHPDMINEAIVVDQIPRKYKTSTIEPKEKMAAVINEFAVLVKPHSKGKAPRPPVVADHSNPEYETDSLERTQKRPSPNGFHTPTDYGDVSSSHPSPSLSNALPLDEEMTMRNAVFNEEHEYELIDKYKLPELLHRDDCYSLVSEVYVNNGYNYDSAPTSLSASDESDCSSTQSLHNRPPKVHYTEPEKPGHLLIEVEDCANNYIRVEDSDQFEPDTLDRKPNKQENPKDQILLRTTGSFKNDSETQYLKNDQIQSYFNRNFGSLREIYEAKTKIRSLDGAPNSLDDSEASWQCEDEGRILTLEERHARRQRKSTPPNTIIKTAPPDVIPPISGRLSPIYQQPKPPRKVLDDGLVKAPVLPPKNAIGRGTMKSMDIEAISPSVSLPSTLSGTSVNSKQSSEIHLENCTPKIVNQLNILKARNEIQRKLESDALLNDMIKDSGAEIQTHFCSKNKTWSTLGGVKSPRPEDSGYLSTDSNDIRQDVLEEKTEGSSLSETDESLGDGHSESGAESMETHSVFFDSFRKKSANADNTLVGSFDSGVSCKWMKAAQVGIGGFVNNFDETLADQSFVTVLPLTSAKHSH